MKIGTVFKWLDYPKPIDGLIKDRWFVYFGTTSILATLQNVFIFTTTTEIELYEMGNIRQGHKNISYFKGGEFGFEKDCVLDPFFFQDNWLVNEFNSYKDSFIIKGKLTNEKLRDCYNKLLYEDKIETIIKRDIRRNLNNIEIYDLKIPK
ncbi:hypothetical protein ES708_22738 [subsurface metagenome]